MTEMTPDGRYFVLNGDRLKALEQSVKEARDAAMAAAAAVRAFGENSTLWRAQVCDRHTSQLEDLGRTAAANGRRLDSRWPTLIMTFAAQMIGAIVVFVGLAKFMLPALVAAQVAEKVAR